MEYRECSVDWNKHHRLLGNWGQEELPMQKISSKNKSNKAGIQLTCDIILLKPYRYTEAKDLNNFS